MKNFVQDGDRLTFPKSILVGPNNPILSGDPVVVGRLAGVAAADAVPATGGIANDLNVVVQVRGVFTLAVQSLHNNVTPGESVYIDPVTGVVSDDFTDVPFGVVLDQVNSGATTSVRVRLFGATPGATGAGS